MYRPTVRCDDIYKKYIDSVYKSTSLDRNQIIRLALFAAPFNSLFNAQVEKHLTSLPPSPLWEVVDHRLWLEQSPRTKEKGDDVNAQRTEQTARQERAVYSQPVKVKYQRGATIKVEG